MAKLIDTDAISTRYRAASIDLQRRRLLLTNFRETEQEKDLSVPPNCGGFGRVRHFRRGPSPRWVANPLPIDPACRALGLPPTDLLRAQAFQNAACNWRCWYCFVPFNLLAADPRRSGWMTPEALLDLYVAEPNRPAVIDLTGGQPDLIPEWVPWTMEALSAHGLSERVFLWSDDNLSNDYFWQHLTEADRERVATFRNYARVCCFKGFDGTSFEFNTTAPAALFDRQFDLMARLLSLGIDLYGYVTLTTPSTEGMESAMSRFIDRLQCIDEMLPLRIVPLEVQVFTPVRSRLTPARAASIEHQYAALEAWVRELEARFTASDRALSITEVSVGHRRR